MGEFDSILDDYSRLRSEGVSPKEALSRLRDKIEPLPKQFKERLAGVIRAYEAGGGAKGAPQKSEALATTVSRVVKPLPRIQPPGDTFAQPFTPQSYGGATRKLSSDAVPRNDLFGPQSVLLLRIHPAMTILELRPQFAQREMVVGRSDANSSVFPDVDLAPYNAANLGVSRRHMAIRFDSDRNQLQMVDNSSANGVFVNGQRLANKEVRVLRHGDQVQLGELQMDVAFRHDR